MPHSSEYSYRVLWSDEDQKHVGLVVEFPSLSWLASTQQEALDGITNLVTEILADMEVSKEMPPTPLKEVTWQK